MIYLVPGAGRGALYAYGVKGGVLADPVALAYAVVRLAAGGDVEVVPRTAIVVGPSVPAPDRAGAGRYLVPWDVPGDAPAGEYELRVWTTQDTGDAEVASCVPFEVQTTRFRRDVYGSFTRLRATLPTTGVRAVTDAGIARAMERAAGLIEKFTRRVFVAKWLVFDHTGDPLRLLFRTPIVAIDRIEALQDATLLPAWDFAGGDAIVFNRHLSGLLDPDDRESPKIEYRGIWPYARHAPRRGRAHMRVSGLFGYTDPDGSVTGATPSPITDVAEALASFFATGGQLGAAGNAYGVVSESTREQSVSYGNAGSGGRGYQFVGAYTGNPAWDGVLAMYAAPPVVGAA